MHAYINIHTYIHTYTHTYSYKCAYAMREHCLRSNNKISK